MRKQALGVSTLRIIAAAALLGAVLTLAAAPASANDSNDPRDTSSPYGMLEFLVWDHDWNQFHYKSADHRKKAMDLMRDAGVGIVRIDFLWADLEPQRNRYDFSRIDEVVNELGKRNIKVLGMLHYNSAWSGKEWNTPPDPKAFASYADKVVTRFKDRVKYWEIWNEPNSPIYWKPQDGMRAYTELLKVVYPAIKKADPTAVVLMGGLTGNPDQSLNEIYLNGGKPYFDRVNIHPFRTPSDPAAIDRVRELHEKVLEVMKRHGDADKKVWFTEIGSPGVSGGIQPTWWLGKAPNELIQAQWVKAVMGEMTKWPSVEKVFWAFFRDTDHFKDAVDYFGIVRKDWTLKPGYEAYRKVATRSAE